MTDFLGGDGAEGAVEVVDAFDEVGREAGDGEGAGGVDVPLGAVLEVAEVGYGAEVFVLEGVSVWRRWGEWGRTFRSIISLVFDSSSFVLGSSSLGCVSEAPCAGISVLTSAAGSVAVE